MSIYDTRQLILYDNLSMAYFNPSTGEKRGEIKLTKECNAFGVSASKPKSFKLKVPKRVYNFQSIEFPAGKWIDSINEQIQTIK